MPRKPKPPEPAQKRRSPGQGQVYADRSRNRWIAAITVDGRLVRRSFPDEAAAKAGLLALQAQLAAQTIDVSRQTLRGVAQGKAQRLAAGKSWHDLGLVFPDNDGRPLREPKVLKAWDRMLKDAGLPKCRIHDLRHSFAGIALGHGAELLGVSRALGHANTAITDRVYAGRAFQDARRASDAVGTVLAEDEAAT